MLVMESAATRRSFLKFLLEPEEDTKEGVCSIRPSEKKRSKAFICPHLEKKLPERRRPPRRANPEEGTRERVETQLLQGARSTGSAYTERPERNQLPGPERRGEDLQKHLAPQLSSFAPELTACRCSSSYRSTAEEKQRMERRESGRVGDKKKKVKVFRLKEWREREGGRALRPTG